MRLIVFGFAVVLATAALADTLTLKSGRVINGTYLGGTARQVRVDVGDHIETVDVTNINKIEFSSGAPATPAPAAAATPPPVRQEVFRPSPTQAAASTPRATAPVTVPAGTNVVIRMIDGVDSEIDGVGKTFAASIDEPVIVNGETVVPRGADVVVKLVDAKESGAFTGRSALTLNLVSVKVDGRVVDLNTQTVSRESASRTSQTAKAAAGVGAVGAIIGAIAGGGQGAAIGAAAGGAAGAGSGLILGGEKVKIPSETRLTFVLDTDVRI